MWNPRQRIGNRRGIDLTRQLVAQEAVELVILDDVEGSAGDVVALLIACRDEAGAHVDADLRLPEAITEHRGGAAVGRDSEHAAVVLADGRRFLTALGDDELAARREAHGAREFAVVGGLREGVREELVDVGLAVAVGVAQAPDAVAVEDVDLLVFDRERQRLVQARRESLPCDGPARLDAGRGRSTRRRRG